MAEQPYMPVALVTDETPIEIAPGVIVTLGDLKEHSREELLAATRRTEPGTRGGGE